MAAGTSEGATALRGFILGVVRSNERSAVGWLIPRALNKHNPLAAPLLDKHRALMPLCICNAICSIEITINYSESRIRLSSLGFVLYSKFTLHTALN